VSNQEAHATFITFEQLCLLGINYSRVHLRRLIRDGDFPAAYELSPNRVAWKRSEIMLWLANRAVRRP